LVVRCSFVVIASILFFFEAPQVSAQPSEWFGTWTLNLEKSVYSPDPPPYKRATMKVEPLGRGCVRFSYDFVYPRGGLQHVEWDGRFDGNDYIVQGTDEYVTYAYRQTGERTYEVTAKLDSRITAVAAVTMSPDGRRLTTTTRRRSARGQLTNTTVYEKKGGPGQLALQGEGLHLEPSGSFLKCELVTKS
jgi:hypothetical protein